MALAAVNAAFQLTGRMHMFDMAMYSKADFSAVARHKLGTQLQMNCRLYGLD